MLGPARRPARTMAGMGWRGSTSRIMVVAWSVFLVGACSAESPAPPPKALSVQEYRTTLTGALDPLESTLKRFAKANGYKGLDGRVTNVETAAAEALTELKPITPPPELA